MSTIVGNKAIIKGRGDPGAAPSLAFQGETPYLVRRPYLNYQLTGYSQRATAAAWRRVLYSSPTVWACVKSLNDQLVALPHHITTKDKSQRSIHEGLIDYYEEEVIAKFNGENFDTGTMRTNRDVLTIPMGGNCEVVRKISGPWQGEVDRVENLDGGTLAPTGDYWYPIIQRDPDDFDKYVLFGKDDIQRILLNPRPEFGLLSEMQQAPLEMCYLAIDAISKGDFYYLNQLTETPSAGILDLKDMAKKEAIEWAKSWRELLTGNDALKIPILYDHEEDAKWIPFGPPPESAMVNDGLDRYTKLIHACFGMYTQDTGLTERDASPGGQGGATLDRKSWHKFNALVAVWENFWNAVLPNILVFKFEEVNIEETERIARAAVAEANALGIYARMGALGLTEVRRELQESGFLSIYIDTEKLPEDTVAALAMEMAMENPRTVVDGQSRWPEQRTPAEGRRTAQPSSKTSPRSEWYNRVRPKAFVEMTTLTSSLNAAFQRIADVPEEALKSLVKSASIAMVNVVQEAKSFTGGSYNRWLEEYFRLDAGEDSLLKAKAVIRGQKKADAVIQDMLLEYDWWDINDTPLMLMASSSFKSAYEDALEEFANEIYDELNLQGQVDTSVPDDYQAILTNFLVLGELDTAARTMIENLNQGTQYYLKRALARAVMFNLSRADVRKQINDSDERAPEIIAVLGLADDIAVSFKSELIALIQPRAERASAFELSNIRGKARFDALRAMGFTTKSWKMLGPEPCMICRGNAALGDVPLDFPYDSVYGQILWPLAHLYGMCDISFNKNELENMYQTTEGILLYSGD